jgi:hypothetical protein
MPSGLGPPGSKRGLPGKELSWDLPRGEKEGIHFRFSPALLLPVIPARILGASITLSGNF